MSIVTITLNNRDFKLLCPEENHTELRSLAEILDLEINKLRQANAGASFELLLVMLSLSLLDNKQKNISPNSNEILQDANRGFQIILAGVFDELKTVANKLEK